MFWGSMPKVRTWSSLVDTATKWCRMASCPAPSPPRSQSRADAAFVKVFTSALQVAAPVLLAILITDAGFGMVSRVVPQLNVFQVGFPSKVLVGLLLIGVSLPFVGGWLASELQTDVGLALHSLRVTG